MAPTGPALGISDDSDYLDERRAFPPGSVLVLYSDGITEARRNGAFYGEERLIRLVATLATDARSARDIAGAVLEDVKAYSGSPPDDDITLLVIRAAEP